MSNEAGQDRHRQAGIFSDVLLPNLRELYDDAGIRGAESSMDFTDGFALIAIRLGPHWIEYPGVRTAHRKIIFEFPCQAGPAVFRREDLDDQKRRSL
jgi:hypothetical protein